MRDRSGSHGERLYRFFLRLFPADFRGDFGDEMSADFREARDDARRRGGRSAAAGVWLRTIADLARRAPREQADAIAADVRFALRMMRRHAASSAVLILLLALGIGANAAVFGAVDPLIRRPLPVPAGRDLIRINATDAGRWNTFSYAVYEDLVQRTRTLDGIAAHQYVTVTAGSGEASRPLGGEIVSGEYFDVYGVRPALGRMLRPSDDREVGGHSVVVISHGLWREQFGAAPDAVGRTIDLNGRRFEIVGVAPAGFAGSYTAFTTRFWAPTSMHKQVRPTNLDRRMRGWGWLFLTARLKPGVALEAASSDLTRIAGDLHREHPQPGDAPIYSAVRASGLPEGLRQSAASAVTFAATIAILVLLVTCANVAGLLHSRAAARLKETAVRCALGASRFRVVRQWLTEALVLALAGAAGALIVQRWIRGGLAALLRSSVPPHLAPAAPPGAPDASLVLFTLALAIASAVVFGILPALRSASRGEAALREASASVTRSRGASRATRALVAIQVSVCLCLLVTAGLLTRSLQNARTFDPGFPSSGLVVARVGMQAFDFDATRASVFHQRLAERLSATPGVLAVSRARIVPLGGDQERQGFRIPGHVDRSGRSGVSIDVNAVGAGYFEALGLPLAEGRGFTAADVEGGRLVAVINETMARRYWPSRSPIGTTIVAPGRTGDRTFEIVGVARDIKYYALDEAAIPYVYVSADQIGTAAPVLHVRVAGPAAPFVSVVKRETAAVDAAVVLDPATTFEELRREPLALRRAMTVMAGAFGALALTLTIVGVYGTMTNAVGQRAREIGVRMAFGATVRDVFQLILRDGLGPVAIGLALGLAAASFVSRIVAGELFGVTAGDPFTHALAALAIVATAVAALSLPARHATRVDPVTVLRE